MEKFITKLRNKPEQTRQRILLTTLFIVGVILIVIFVLTFGDRRRAEGGKVQREVQLIFSKFNQSGDIFNQ